MRQWDACRGRAELPRARRRRSRAHECYAGLDLASTEDLTALVLVFPDDGERRCCPSSGARRRGPSTRERSATACPTSGWARDGFLHLTDGNATDFDHVEQHRRSSSRSATGSNCLGLRPLRGRAGREPPAGHAGVDVVLFGQGYVSMNAPSKHLDVLVRSRARTPSRGAPPSSPPATSRPGTRRTTRSGHRELGSSRLHVKSASAAMCRELGVSHPRTPVGSLDATAALPLVLKPDNGSCGRGIRLGLTAPHDRKRFCRPA